MQAISKYLSQLEDTTDLQGDVIRETKIRRALMEILNLDIVPRGSEFQFKIRFERLLERCNKALEREKILADNTEQLASPPETSTDENSHSTAETKGSTPDTRTSKAYFQYSLVVLTFQVSNTPLLSLKVADNSQPKRKRQLGDHVIGKTKRFWKTRKLELFVT